MFCTRCGQSNPEDSVFCSACGHAMSVVPQPGTASWPQAAQQVSVPPQDPIASPPQAPTPPQNQYYYGAPQQPYTPQGAYVRPKKKSRTGLVVGLTVGGTLLIAAVVALLFVCPGFLSVPVNGFWYSEERGEALEFKNGGGIRVYTTDNEFRGNYTYDSQGMGHITVDDEDYQFAVTEDGLYVESMGNYKQAETDFDVDDFIDDVSFNEVDSRSTDDNLTANDQTDNNNVSTASSFSDIYGLWYETTGYAGTIHFYTDGTYEMTMTGNVLSGIFDYKTSNGEVTLFPDTYQFTYENGVLFWEDFQYTRDYVEQYDRNDMENLDLV